MRIACISHGSIVPLNRRPFDLLVTEHRLDLTLLVPERWVGDLPDPDLHFAPTGGGAPAIALPARFSGNGSLFTLRGLGRALDRLRPDLVLLDEEPWSLAAWQTLRSRLPDRLIVYSKQNIAKRLPPPFSFIRRATYRRARSAWAVGVTTEAVLRSTGYRGAVSVVTHGVEVARFSPGRDDDRRRALGLEGVVIGYAGRFVEEKGLTDLVAAVSLLARVDGIPRFTLLLAGSGPLEPALRAQAAPLGARCVFHPAVPHESAPELFRLMDLYVLPSRATARWQEQFGRVLVEAGASALPIVAAATGEIPHVVRQLGGGRLVPERDPQALGAALREMVADEGARHEAGRANLVAAHRDFSQEAVAARMAGLLMAEGAD